MYVFYPPKPHIIVFKTLYEPFLSSAGKVKLNDLSPKKEESKKTISSPQSSDKSKYVFPS